MRRLKVQEESAIAAAWAAAETLPLPTDKTGLMTQKMNAKSAIRSWLDEFREENGCEPSDSDFNGPYPGKSLRLFTTLLSFFAFAFLPLPLPLPLSSVCCMLYIYLSLLILCILCILHSVFLFYSFCLSVISFIVRVVRKT